MYMFLFKSIPTCPLERYAARVLHHRRAPVLKRFFHQCVISYILVASLTLVALFKTEPSELVWPHVCAMTH